LTSPLRLHLTPEQLLLLVVLLLLAVVLVLVLAVVGLLSVALPLFPVVLRLLWRLPLLRRAPSPLSVKFRLLPPRLVAPPPLPPLLVVAGLAAVAAWGWAA
jgi:hypothetical protein